MARQEIVQHAVTDVLSLCIDRQGGTVFVRLTGEVDLAAEESLDKVLGSLASEADFRCLVVDMSAVSFLDTVGIRVLVKQEMWSRRDGFDFGLVQPSGPALRALALTGVDRLIELRSPNGLRIGKRAEAGERASAGLGTSDDPDDRIPLWTKPILRSGASPVEH